MGKVKNLVMQKKVCPNVNLFSVDMISCHICGSIFTHTRIYLKSDESQLLGKGQGEKHYI